MLEALLKIHRDPEELDFDALWATALFIFDANVLLDLYRLPESASNDLIGVLRHAQLKERIWVPFQTIVEFLGNRQETIGDQKGKFNDVRSLIAQAEQNYDGIFSALSGELSKLNLKQRHSLIDPDKYITPEKIEQGKQLLRTFAADLSQLEVKQPDVHNEDTIKHIVLDLFKEKIGEGFDQAALVEIYKQGGNRYEARIPPGFKDKAKTGSVKVGDREILRKYGDLILWKEIMQKAKSDSIENIVLITGDVKDDWWIEKRGKRLGPHRELLNEIYSEAPSVQTFYMYDTASFLKHAKRHLKAKVDDETISLALGLREVNRANSELGIKELVDLAAHIKSVAQDRFAPLRILIHSSVSQLPLLKISANRLTMFLFEIFDNVMTHGDFPSLVVSANEFEQDVRVFFASKTRLNEDPRSLDFTWINRTTSGNNTGLKLASDLLAREGIRLEATISGSTFTIEINIPKSKFEGPFM